MLKKAFFEKAWESFVLFSRERVKVLFYLMNAFILVAFTLNASGQTPGLIYKPSSTTTGKSIMDPNGDGYVSASSSGFTSSDYGTASELQMVSIPLMISEPSGDLGTGATGGHTEIVSLDGGNSVFVLKRTVSGTDYLVVRFRIGKASTARKGYSLLIDTDNQFGNSTSSNPGFEKEVILETGFGVKIYTHNVAAGTSTSLLYDLEEHHQRSIAYSTNGGDADYFYDFYVPYNDLGLTGNVRFAATTITSAQSGITGTASDINGLNDQSFGGNATAIYTAAINSFPPTDLSTITAGATFAPLVTTAPTITSALSTSSTSISGTSLEPDLTIITVYKGGVSIGTATVSSNAWTLTGVSGLAAGNLITAKALASSKSISTASNTVEVTAPIACYTPIPVMGAKVNGSQSMPGTWTRADGSAILANTVKIRLYRQTIGTNTFTEIVATPAVYVSAATSGAGSFSFPTGLTQSDFNGARLFATAEENGCVSGYSASSDVNSGSNLTTAPTITTSSATPNTGSTTITVQSNYTASTLILYKNGIEVGRSAGTFNSAATTTFSVSGLLEGDRLTARAQGNGATDVLSNESAALIVSASSSTSATPAITNTYIAGSSKTVTGTSTEIAGTTIYLYKTASSVTNLLGTTTVNAFGNWSVAGLTLTSGDVLTAKADAVGKSLSAASVSVTVATTAPTAPGVDAGIVAGASSVTGTLGNTLVKLYIDGSALSTTSTAATWSIATASGEIYKGAKVKATNTVSGIESAYSNEVTVTGVNDFLVESSAGGNIGTQTAGTPFTIKITARNSVPATFTSYTGTNTVSSGSTMTSGAGPTSAFSSGVLSSHSVTLTKAGTYSLTTVSTTDPGTVGTSNTFTINPGAAATLSVFTQPSTTATSGTQFSQQPVVYIYDAYGNLATNNSTLQVTASIASGSGTLSGTVTVTAVNGVATFTNLKIGGAGAHTLTFSGTSVSSATSNSIAISGVAPSALSYTSPNTFTVGSAITSLTPTVTGTVSSYSISPALPAGLNFNTSTGAISGTPTAVAAQADYTVTATNSTGSTTFNVSITVQIAAPSALSYTSPNTFTVGSAITSLTPTVTGTVSSYSISPSLPTGLSFSTSTGAISGTPTAAAAQGTYTVTATNSTGSTTFGVVITVQIAAPTALSYTSPNTFTVGSAITTLTPTVTGTVSSYSISPSLPAGLSFSTSTGAISGTPTVATAQGTYTVTATNSTGSTTFGVVITVQIAAPSALSYTSPNIFTVGSAITSLTPTVTGTVSSYVISPALPAGLSFSTSTGAISGTPTTATAQGTYTVTATNSTGSTTFGVVITIQIAAPSALSYTSPNTFTVGSAITSLTPTVTGTVSSYSISPALPAGLSFSTSTGAISGTPTTAASQADYTVTATNATGSTTFNVSITVQIAAPSALSYTSPNTFTVGSAITTLNPAVTGTVSSYSISPSLPAGLSFSTSTGAISGTPTAAAAQGTYTVTATNSTGSTTFGVVITVQTAAPSALSYTSPNTFTVGSAITTLNPTVTGTVSSYSISPSLPAGLSFNTSTGAISGTPTAAASQADYTVTATNATGSTTFNVSITVQIAAPSALSYTSPNTFTVGSAITALTPTVTGTVSSYSISPSLPAGLSFSTSTGAITGTPTAAASQTDYTVTATNSTGSTTYNVSITVQIAAPSALSYTSPNTFTVGSAITTLTPTVTGTVSSYSISPSLPAGLSFSTSTGAISGTPTAAAGQADYTVTATNSTGSTTFNVSITVQIAAPSALSYTSPNAFTVGSAITTLTPTVTGTVSSYSISPSLPAGLSFSTSTGAISGTPTAAAGQADYTVTATNSTGNTTFNVSITVQIAAPSALSYTSPNVFTVGSAITTLTPTVTGTVSSYSISPSLPAGLSFSTSIGAISGTPTAAAGQGTYTVTATNSTGSTTFGVVITVQIAAPSALSYTSPNTFTVGSAITSLTPTVTGTVSSYSISPSLPAGLSFSTSTGAISGTPTTAAAQGTYTVTATNSTGSTTFGIVITVQIATPSALSYTSPNTFTVGSAITTLNPTVTGTVSSYSISPSLPAGLSFSTSTGAISGTPTAAAGQADYTVTATNSTGSTTFNVSITVQIAAPSALSYTLPNTFTVGTAITTLNPTVTGTVSSYSISPSLPAGLSFSTSTGAISGTPTAAAAQADYTVTATNSTGSTTYNVSITVQIAAPSALSYTSPNVFTVGSAITTLTPTVTGTVSSYSISPSLPAGLSFSTSTGAISGTPTAAAAQADYTVTATNSTGSTTFNVSITVQIAAPSALSYTSPNTFTVGSAITTLTPTVTGTVSSYSISPSLPAGLSFSTSTGAISGTPTAAAGQADYTVTATNSTGSTTFNVSITVQIAAPSALSYTSPNTFTVGTAITSLTPTVTGTVSSYSISPSLPAGLSFRASTGAISGTPTAAAAQGTYTVTATNSTGSTTFGVVITIQIAAPSALSYTSPNTFTVGSAITTLTPTVTGTVSSYSISPSLPAGLSFSTSTGAISGTPTAAASRTTYTVTAINSTGSTNISVMITVNSALAISISSQTDVITYGASTGSVTLNATGGAGGYQYRIGDGTYQLTNSFTGLSAGPYVITVKDANGSTATVQVTITQPIPRLILVVTSQNNISSFGANSGAVVVAASGGTGPYEFKLNDGSYQTSSSFNNLAAGTYTVTVKDASGQTSILNVTITQPSAALILQVASKGNVSVFGLLDGSVTLSASGGTAPYQYRLKAAFFQASPEFNNLPAETYTATVQDANGNIATVSFTITQPAALSASLEKTDILTIGTTSGTVKVNASGGVGPYTYKLNTGNYQDSDFFDKLAAGSYIIVVKDANGATKTIEFTIAQKSSLPNVFSPNGDGVNDGWVMEGIESFPPHVLTVFDRSGRVLYQAKNYKNDWNGTVEGKPLEEGTYYYVIRFDKDALPVKKGFITIVR